jgi:hypothetical protein
MNRKLYKIQTRQRRARNLNSVSTDLKYWEKMTILNEHDQLEETRVIESSDYILYQLDANNTLNVPKKMGVCYGKK